MWEKRHQKRERAWSLEIDMTKWRGKASGCKREMGQ